ncbi:MAG: tRNA uridine-5-carboxymethylaminomethyl(34) synthesis GTPase MnmE [Alphaproteobacteria bacterium]|nr:tRNA uridine-5-carboxymethylaminomethyl(34) synthesis GTPase MnmE [Alphaproteobacteria bacterium]
MNNDIIFALSSGHGKSGVAVIRVSGNNLRDMFARISGKKSFDARKTYLINMRDTAGDLIDQCLVIYFAAPNSFTGTDIIEIHSHGAPAVIERIFTYLSETFGARMATPGEFSRRAFYNNKMDLADIDGLAALLDATTDRQRRAALQSMTGYDSQIYNDWRGQMIEISAYAAAMLDYEPDDLPKNIGDTLRARTQKLYDEISSALASTRRARAIRGGYNIVLVGDPNVGKSSIFNRIVGSNRAIVSDIAGTTRDVVSASLDIDGYFVNLSDTAGLRDDASDEIEKIGIERTNMEMQNADLIIRVFTNKVKVNYQPNQIIVINKSDLLSEKTNKNIIYVSAKTGDGMDKLMDAIRDKIHHDLSGAETQVAINNRTRMLLTDACDALKNALDLSSNNYDIFTEHVRIAADSIGKILGTITASEVLDATFGQLCLGK